MPIVWSEFSKLRNKNEVSNKIREVINAATYGFGPGQWTLTELLQQHTLEPVRVALQILSGIDATSGERTGPGMTDAEGNPMRITLKVLTRQACRANAAAVIAPLNETSEIRLLDTKGERIKGAKVINGFDRYMDDEYLDDAGATVIAPVHGDKPKEGDIVQIAGDFKQRDHEIPDEENRLTSDKREALHMRVQNRCGYAMKQNEATWKAILRRVSKDGRITLGVAAALQVLKINGKDLALRKFRRIEKRAPNDQRKLPDERRLVNWWFEEVPPKT